MSLEERQPIAEALSQVDGVTGFAYRPNATKVGNAWPRWIGCTRVSGGSFETAWQIVVLVPSDEVAAEAWIEERLQDLVDALSSVLYVADAVPGVSAETPALLLNCKE